MHRVHGDPMFDVVVHLPASNAARVCKVMEPPDVAAQVWEELKLDNNPKLANDATLREHALKMIGEVVDAFHKPAPLLRTRRMRSLSPHACTVFLQIACQR